MTPEANKKHREYWFLLPTGAVWLAHYLARLVLNLSRGLAHPLVCFSEDSYDYDAFLLKNLFDQGPRADVPLYGALLDLFELLFGEGRFTAVVILQTVLSFVSLVYFYRTLREAGIRARAAQAVTLLYGVSTAVLGWNNVILTESFCLSGTVFLLYHVVRFLYREQLRDGLWSIAIAFVLIFVRPQFLLYYLILLCYFVFRLFFTDRRGRRTGGRLIAVMCAGGALILGYCCLFQKAYGIFSLSTAKARQDFFICTSEGFYKSWPDESLAADVEHWQQEYEAWDGEFVYGQTPYHRMLAYYVDKYGHKGMADIAGACFAANRRGRLAYVARMIYEARKEAFWGLGGIPGAPFDTLCVGHVLLLSVLEGLAVAVLWVRRKSPPWLHMCLFAFLFPMAWVTFFVTNGGFMRVMLYTVPPAFLSIALAAQAFCLRVYGAGARADKS